MNLPPEVVALLKSARTIAVLGLSSNPERPSYGVARYLQQCGYRVVPVNPRESAVLGERSFASLHEAAATAAIEVVDVFRRSEYVPEVARAAVAAGARLLWLQEGITNPAAEAEARAAGLQVVANRCLLKEIARLRAAGVWEEIHG